MSGMTAAPVTIPLVDGTEYRMSPLTDVDIDELDQWVQARVILNAQHSLKPEQSQAERDEVLAAAMRASVEVTWVSGVGAKIISTVEGFCRLIWMGARKNHPGLTVANVRAKLLDAENLERARVAFDRANRVSKPRKGPPNKGPRKARRR